jgi:hypothetical protein
MVAISLLLQISFQINSVISKIPHPNANTPMNSDSNLTEQNKIIERKRLNIWWVMTESNRRHSACKADALPTELITHKENSKT